MRIENRRSCPCLIKAMPQAHAPPIFRILHAADEIQEPGHARREVYPLAPRSRARRRGIVGGKNASLGELYQQLKPLGVEVPDGFALTPPRSVTR